MTLDDLINSMTPDVYRNLKQGVELGKWPNGVKLTQEQKETSMQAILIYEQRNLGEEDRTGYMEQACKSSTENKQGDDEQPLTIK